MGSGNSLGLSDIFKVLACLQLCSQCPVGNVESLRNLVLDLRAIEFEWLYKRINVRLCSRCIRVAVIGRSRITGYLNWSCRVCCCNWSSLLSSIVFHRISYMSHPGWSHHLNNRFCGVHRGGLPLWGVAGVSPAALFSSRTPPQAGCKRSKKGLSGDTPHPRLGVKPPAPPVW